MNSVTKPQLASKNGARIYQNTVLALQEAEELSGCVETGDYIQLMTAIVAEASARIINAQADLIRPKNVLPFIKSISDESDLGGARTHVELDNGRLLVITDTDDVINDVIKQGRLIGVYDSVENFIDGQQPEVIIKLTAASVEGPTTTVSTDTDGSDVHIAEGVIIIKSTRKE
jgi:hypothetical protein